MTATLPSTLGAAAGPRPPQARRLRRAVAAWLPSAVALTLGLLGLTSPSLWRDEAVSYTVAQESVGQIQQLTRTVDAVHEVYYLLVHLVFLVGTPSPGLLRAPSVLAVAATAWFVAATLRRLAGPRAGLLAGLSWACVPLVSRYAQEGRSYALVSLAVAAAVYLLLRGVEAGEAGRRTAWWWSGYAVAVAVAGALNVMALLSLPAFAVTVALWRPGWAAALRWAAASVLGALAVLPVALRSAGQTNAVDWLSAPTWRTPFALAADFAGGRAALPLVLVAVLLVALRRSPGGRSGGSPGRRRGPVALAVPLLLLPPGVLLLVSLQHSFYQPRYVLYALIGLSFLIGAGWDAAARRLPVRPEPAAVAALAAVAATAALGIPAQLQLRQSDGHGSDARALAEAVAVRARPGDAVVFASLPARSIAFAYPRDFAGTADVALLSAFNPLKPDGLERPPAATAALLGRYARVWYVYSGHRNLRTGTRDQVLLQAVSGTRRLAGTWSADGQSVQLFTR
ncbi:glycosyltransferase family 39 protein [Streptacidiphilus cavernicola]|uniref:Glycosyltransferase family 39 protein n=1 Tax=Streptacidiphilus cavernicola TaxID=3342716 RepID=A0ABV6W066_9ACTN